MKLRTLLLVAGALFVVGGTTAFGGENLGTMNQNESVYQLEDRYPDREVNRNWMRDTFEERGFDNRERQKESYDQSYEEYGMMGPRRWFPSRNHSRFHCGFRR